jgi:hypothetical protein
MDPGTEADSEDEGGDIDIFGFGCSNDASSEGFNPFPGQASEYHANFQNINLSIDPYEENPREEFLHHERFEVEARAAEATEDIDLW